MVDQANEDVVQELPREVVLCGTVFLFPLLNGLAFCICEVGSVFWNGTHGCPIKVAPAVHGLHSFSEMHGKDGPVGCVILEIWDGSEEYWKRHDDVL